MNIVVQLIRKGWVDATRGDVTVHVRGQAHLGDEYLDTQALAERFLAVALQSSNPPNLQSSKLPALVSSLNGNWAAVVHTSSSAFLAVDHIRSIQLLYSQEGEDFYVFDDVNDFRKKRSLELDETFVHEYLSSGFVWRGDTIFKKVKSVKAGELIEVDSRGILHTDYHVPYPNLGKISCDEQTLIAKIEETFKRATRRLLESVNGRRIVVPLSGGYDSRLLVNYLHKVGCNNVLCYTYGRKGNQDSSCSEQVAKALGYEWHFVECTDTDERELFASDEFRSYSSFACNGDNTPIKQEFLPIKRLKDHGVLKDSDVIVPGHCFDIYAGSAISRANFFWCMPSQIYGNTSAMMFAEGAYSRTIRDLRKYVHENRKAANADAYEIFSRRENITKVIYNAVRAYEWFGFDWRMPLTDMEVTNLWLEIPWRLRYGRVWFKTEVAPRLWVKELRDIPFNGYGYCVAKEHPLHERVCEYIKDHIPYFVVRMLRGGRSIKYSSVSVSAKRLWDMPCVKERVDFLVNYLNSVGLCSAAARIAYNTLEKFRGGGSRVLCVLSGLSDSLRKELDGITA